jgi:hypothetical protein
MASPTCPDDQTLAALADGLLPESERSAALAHLDRCEACTESFAALAALMDAPPAVAPRDVVARTIKPRLVARPVRRLAGIAAAAAAVLVAVMVWPVRDASSPAPATAPPVPSDSPVRSGSGVGMLVLDVPHDNEELSAGFEVTWHGLPDATFYEVQVTTPEGDVIWSSRVDGARQSVIVPEALPVAKPSYVWVTAHLREGRRVTSNVVRIKGRPTD